MLNALGRILLFFAICFAFLQSEIRFDNAFDGEPVEWLETENEHEHQEESEWVNTFKWLTKHQKKNGCSQVIETNNKPSFSANTSSLFSLHFPEISTPPPEM